VFLLALIVGLTGATSRGESQPPAGQPAAAAAIAGPPTGAAAEVERVERELVAAISRTDLATYDRIVADDYIAYTVTGRMTTKAEVLASYRSGTRRYSSLTISDVSVRVFGDTAVLCATTSGTRVEEGGPSVPNVVRYFRVFTMRRGVWRAVMQMVTPLPAPQ
jgi:ketosteroid isomerase-like protein